MAEASQSDYVMVAAIDIGSYSSGYAFSTNYDPLKIYINPTWYALWLETHKTPTCVLLNPSGQFDSFGYEAEDTFADLVEDQEHTGWMFFQNFPLTLHNNKVHIIVVF